MNSMAELNADIEAVADDTDEQQEDETQVLTLTTRDRCDRCGSQAYVLVKRGEQALLFCGHHYARNEVRLKDFADTILDRRSTIPK